MEDIYKVLMELKSDIGSLKTNVEGVKEDVNDLKKLLTHIVRIEEKQVELEKKQQQIAQNLIKISDLEKDLVLTKQELKTIKVWIDTKQEETKEVKKNFIKLAFSVVERIIVYIVLLILSIKNYINGG